jgi:hypothetical protein
MEALQYRGNDVRRATTKEACLEKCSADVENQSIKLRLQIQPKS